jgi:hypothetical protein
MEKPDSIVRSRAHVGALSEEYFAGPFVIDARRGKVKGPQQQAFTPDAWKQGFDK